MKSILCILAAGSLLTGCVTTTDRGSSSRSQAKAKTAQLREGMSQAQVRNLFGSPDEVDHDDGHHHGRGYIPYYGWRRGYGDEELKWEYKSPKLEVVFRREGNNWVVKEWDLD